MNGTEILSLSCKVWPDSENKLGSVHFYLLGTRRIFCVTWDNFISKSRVWNAKKQDGRDEAQNSFACVNSKSLSCTTLLSLLLLFDKIASDSRFEGNIHMKNYSYLSFISF